MGYRQVEYTISTGRPGIFGAALATLSGLVIAALFTLFAIGVAIVLLPFVAVGAGIAWWRWRKFVASLRERRETVQTSDPDGLVIETDYEVVDRR